MNNIMVAIPYTESDNMILCVPTGCPEGISHYAAFLRDVYANTPLVKSDNFFTLPVKCSYVKFALVKKEIVSYSMSLLVSHFKEMWTRSFMIKNRLKWTISLKMMKHVLCWQKGLLVLVKVP